MSLKSYVDGSPCPGFVGPQFVWIVPPTNVTIAPEDPANGMYNGYKAADGGDDFGTCHWSSATYHVEMTDTNSRLRGARE